MNISKRRKSFLFFFVFMSILGFVFNALVTFLVGVPYTFKQLFAAPLLIREYYYFQLGTYLVIFAALFGIIFFLIAGIVRGRRHKLTTKNFKISFYITIIYLFLYYPFVYYNIPGTIWIIFDCLGILFIFYVLVICVKRRTRVTEKVDVGPTLRVIELFEHKKIMLFSKFERISIFILSIISIISLISLSIILLRIPHFYKNINTSTILSDKYITSINYPDYDFSYVLFIITCLLLYFLIKGLCRVYVINDRKRIFNFSILILILTVFILLYWPTPYNPNITVLGWQLLHFIGIVLICFIMFTRNYQIDRESEKILNNNDEHIRLSEREKILLFCFVMISAIGFLHFIIINIMMTFKIFTYHYINYYHPYYIINVIAYIGLIGMFCFSIKILKNSDNIKLKNKLKIIFYILLVLLILYFPKFIIFVNSWLLLSIFAFCFSIFFYNFCNNRSV